MNLHKLIVKHYKKSNEASWEELGVCVSTLVVSVWKNSTKKSINKPSNSSISGL